MKKSAFILFSILLTLVSGGCLWEFVPEFPAGKVWGYRPVYFQGADSAIFASEPESLKNPGKIYLYNNLLFVNEAGKGVHVFDNLDRSNPRAIGFIHITGNVDIAIKNDMLFANNMNDLIGIDISNVNQVKVVSRLPDVFENQENHPPVNDVYFECVDPERGTVFDWVADSLSNPECYF